MSYIYYYWIAFWDLVMTVEVEMVYMGVFIASHSSLDPRACWDKICFFMLRLKDLGVKICKYRTKDRLLPSLWGFSALAGIFVLMLAALNLGLTVPAFVWVFLRYADSVWVSLEDPKGAGWGVWELQVLLWGVGPSLDLITSLARHYDRLAHAPY